MLDRFVARLIWMFWFVSPAAFGGHGVASQIAAAVAVSGLILLLVAWLLGALARTPPRRDATALERVQDRPSNGLEVWKIPPAGGLRPPRPIRWLVQTLGARPGPAGLGSLLVFALTLAAWLCLAAGHSQSWLARLNSGWFSIRTNEAVQRACMALLFLAFVHQWATEQRARLAGAWPFSPPTPWMSIAYIAIFGLFLGLGAVIVFNLPLWIAPAVSAGLVVVELLFGSRAKAVRDRQATEPPGF